MRAKYFILSVCRVGFRLCAVLYQRNDIVLLLQCNVTSGARSTISPISTS